MFDSVFTQRFISSKSPRQTTSEYVVPALSADALLFGNDALATNTLYGGGFGGAFVGDLGCTIKFIPRWAHMSDVSCCGYESIDCAFGMLDPRLIGTTCRCFGFAIGHAAGGRSGGDGFGGIALAWRDTHTGARTVAGALLGLKCYVKKRAKVSVPGDQRNYYMICYHNIYAEC